MNASTLAKHFSRSLKRSLFRFQRERLPSPTAFYATQFTRMRNPRGEWVQVHCCFHHPDRHPSLALNLQSGGFFCFSCGSKGGDVVAFTMLRDGVDFKTAARRLGAWQGDAESPSQRLGRENEARRQKRLSTASVKLEQAERACRLSIRAEIHELERLQMEAKTRLSVSGCAATNGTDKKIDFCWQVLSWTTDSLRRAVASYCIVSFASAKARAEFVMFPETRATAVSAVFDRGYVVDDDGFVFEVPLA